ncbi:MAG: SSI family serine proteinase inhibitor [Gaiellaceae bacterium]
MRRTPSILLPLLLLLLLAAGCGGSASGSSGPTALRITIWPKGKTGSSFTYTLKCPQGTGTLPNARAACSKLRQVSAKTFAPVPTGTACTEIYGGPQTATVSGRLAGNSISADFNRTNGCEIARWERLAFLFPLES